MALKTQFEAPIHCGDHVYIQPTYFIIKPDFINSNLKYSAKQKANEANLKNNKNNGQLSSKSISKLKNSVNWLLDAARYKPVFCKRKKQQFFFKTNFITLTIPPQTTYRDHAIKLKVDKEYNNNLLSKLKVSVPINNLPTVSCKQFQKCMNVFLTYSRKHTNLKLHNYVWKLEAHKDGRLHIHLSTDIFYHYTHLRNCWNSILQREGLLEMHFKKFGNYSPNSTDVHSVYKVRNVAGYICGYMQKKPNLSKGFTGRIWSCSYSLSNKNKCYAYLDKGSDRRNFSFVDRPMIRYKKIEGKADCMGNKKEVASMYMLYGTQWQTEMDGIIKDAYNNHRQSIRDGTPKQPREYMTIDFFGTRSKGNYEYINLAEKKEEPCLEIKKSVKLQSAQMMLSL